MEKIRIPIDRSTVRRNPNAGRSVFYVAGRAYEETTVGEDGTVRICRRQDVQTIYDFPQSAFLWEYAPTEVRCGVCGEAFSHTELETDDTDFGDDGYCSTDRKCPKCGVWDCCELERESLSFSEMLAIVQQRENQFPETGKGLA